MAHASHSFFSDLKAFEKFEETCDNKNYTPAPDDWCIILTDVSGSTQAIQNGRYKDVNMVGAACIAATVNTCAGIDIPYVFGGDGATFLIPPSHIEDVKNALRAVKAFAKKMHNMDLRLGAIPVNEISKRGKIFGVAKFKMPTGASLAMFSGGGATLADSLLKKETQYLIEENDQDNAPNLEGLSCRWQPIPALKDTMLTMIIMSKSAEKEHEIYNDLNTFIHNTLDSNGDLNPVKNENLTYKWPTLEALRQCKMVWKQGNIAKNITEHVLLITLFNIMDRFKLKVKGLDVPAYKQDMITNSDYRKFDDMLRMVVDCSDDQAQKIERHLKSLYDDGLITYGTHYSKTAIMTCFLTSLQKTDHIHFIDGNDGGYAMAAQQLKKRLIEG